MSTDEFIEDQKDFSRNHQGRPFVEVNGKRKTYTRVTTFIGVLDDKTNLHMWQTRLLTSYLVSRTGEDRTETWKELVRRAKEGEGGDKTAFNKAIRAAHLEAGSKEKASIGTRIHAETEAYDDGITYGQSRTPSPWLEAYKALTSGIEMVYIETPVVCDELLAAGTPDRVGDVKKPCQICGRTRRILDVKTGRVDAWTEREQAMQLAIYSHSKGYDPVTGRRYELDVCQHEALIIHLPADSFAPMADSSLFRVDIARGWELVQVAKAVSDARKQKHLVEKIEVGQ